VIKVIRLIPVSLDYFEEQGVPHINLLSEGVREVLPAVLDKILQESPLKFPVQVQTFLKIKFHRVKNGMDEYIIKNIRADDISNATYTANNREGFIKIVLTHLQISLKAKSINFKKREVIGGSTKSRLFTSDSGSTSPCMPLLEVMGRRLIGFVVVGHH
jgi:hypothetical protein